MKSDPIYLFQELTWKASLGVLSVAGNVCRVILFDMYGYVKLELVLKHLGHFSSLFEENRFWNIKEAISISREKEK